MFRSIEVGLVLLLIVAPSVAVADEDRQWGDLVGRFTYDGELPTPAKLEVGRKLANCGPKAPVDESLVVDAESRGVANIFVWLVPKLGEKIAVHPAYEESAKDEVALTMKDCRYQPYAVVLRTTQTLVLSSGDKIAHNPKSYGFNSPLGVLLPAGGLVKVSFVQEENVPFSMGCSIHPWMSARVLVKNHPYMAVSQPDGSFAIRNLPVGSHTFCFAHERTGYLDRPVIDGEVQELKKGKLVSDIEAGEKDLGEIKLAADEFIRK